MHLEALVLDELGKNLLLYFEKSCYENAFCEEPAFDENVTKNILWRNAFWEFRVMKNILWIIYDLSSANLLWKLENVLWRNLFGESFGMKICSVKDLLAMKDVMEIILWRNVFWESCRMKIYVVKNLLVMGNVVEKISWRLVQFEDQFNSVRFESTHNKYGRYSGWRFESDSFVRVDVKTVCWICGNSRIDLRLISINTVDDSGRRFRE